MFTIVASSTTISWAMPMRARISQRRRLLLCGGGHDPELLRSITDRRSLVRRVNRPPVSCQETGGL